jgi:hypothetical protein
MQEMRDIIGNRIIDPYPVLSKLYSNDGAFKFQIYPANPDGSFSEDTSYFYENAYPNEKSASVAVPVSPAQRFIRLDPLRSSCIVTITRADIDGNPYPVDSKKFLLCNGKRVGNDTFIFETEDPNLVFVLEGLARSEDSLLNVEMNITQIPHETAALLAENIKRIF